MDAKARPDQLREASNPAVQRPQVQARHLLHQSQRRLRHHHDRRHLQADWPNTLALARSSPTAWSSRRWCRSAAGRASAARRISTAPASRPSPGPPASAPRPRISGVFATSHVPTVHPIMAAKQATTIDHITGGRFALNIVTGWYKPEIEMFGAPHDGARHALRLRGRMARDHQAAVDRRGRVRLRRQVLPVKKGFSQAEADPGSLIRRDECRRLGEGTPFRRQILRRRLHHVFNPARSRRVPGAGRRAIAELAREEYGRDIQVWTDAYVVQGETEKEAQDFYNYYVHEKGDWVAVDNLVETMGINAQTLPPEASAQQMKAHFIAGWGGYPLVGTNEQIVDELQPA